MKTIKRLPTGVYSVITKGRVEIYTEEEFKNLFYYRQQIWWDKIKSKYFNNNNKL